MTENLPLPAAPGQEAERRLARALADAGRTAAAHGHLALTAPEITALVARRAAVLREADRIEFGTGILPQLVFAFCDSPHIPPAEFAATIDALMECFYHFKNEAAEALGDDELLAFMKERFNGVCQGSVEYLAGTLLEQLAEGIRFGKTAREEQEPPDPEHPDKQEDADAE